MSADGALSVRANTEHPPRKGNTMNAQKKLDANAATIRSLTIERDALKNALYLERKLQAQEQAKVAEQIKGIRKLAVDTAGDPTVILHMIAELLK